VNTLQSELQDRWHLMFTALAAGDDVPPSLRLRTEGLMEAAVITGLASSEQITGQMGEAYQRAFDCTLEESFASDWQDFYPFPQIPAMAKRAPVYPSTAD